MGIGFGAAKSTLNGHYHGYYHLNVDSFDKYLSFRSSNFGLFRLKGVTVVVVVGPGRVRVGVTKAHFPLRIEFITPWVRS